MKKLHKIIDFTELLQNISSYKHFFHKHEFYCVNDTCIPLLLLIALFKNIQLTDVATTTGIPKCWDEELEAKHTLPTIYLGQLCKTLVFYFLFIETNTILKLLY